MVTYVTGETIPDGTILHQIVELEYFKGKAFIKRQYCVVKGDRKKKNAAKKKKAETVKKKAQKELQLEVDKFTKVEQNEEGF